MKSLLYIALMATLAACAGDSEDRTDGFSNTPKNTEDSLFQAVMDQHDVAMAKMGRLAGYRKHVEQQIDSLSKTKSSSASTRQKLEALGADLKHAEDGMNTWMQEFSIDSAQDDSERRMRYLTSEKEKVTKVKDEILSVMARADSLFKK